MSRDSEVREAIEDDLESRLWANDERPSLAGYRQLAFDAISLLKARQQPGHAIQPRGYTLATPMTPRRPQHHRPEAHRG